MCEADSIEAAQAKAADLWKKRPVSWLNAA
jgi:hypothetical protein